MICGALPLFWFEVNLAKPLNLFRQVDSGSVQLGFDLIHARWVYLFTHFSAFIIGLKRLADFFAIVNEIEHERVFLERVDPIETRERLHSLDTAQSFVDIHRVQKWLIETGLIFLRDEKYLVFTRCEFFR